MKRQRYTLAELRRSQKTHPWRSRDGLIAALKAVRKHRVCGYMGDRCDCKYGFTEAPDGSRPQCGSEDTGCPELYEAIGLLSALSQADFDRLFIKAAYRKAKR